MFLHVPGPFGSPPSSTTPEHNVSANHQPLPAQAIQAPGRSFLLLLIPGHHNIFLVSLTLTLNLIRSLTPRHFTKTFFKTLGCLLLAHTQIGKSLLSCVTSGRFSTSVCCFLICQQKGNE